MNSYAVLLCAVLSAPPSRLAETELSALRESIAVALEEYRMSYGSCEELAEITYNYHTPGAATNKSRPRKIVVRAASNGRLSSNEFSKTPDGNAGQEFLSVNVRNGDYQFDAHRAKPDGEFALVTFSPSPPVDKQSSFTGGLTSDVKMGLYLADLAFQGKGGCKLDYAARNPDGSISVVLQKTNQSKTKPTVTTVTANLDPAKKYRVDRIEFRHPASQTLVSHQYADEMFGSIYIPLRTSERVLSPTGELRTEIETSYKLEPFTKSPSDFTLSAYGLPEPLAAVPVSSTPRYLYLLAAALGLGLLAYALRRHARRGAATA